MTRRFVVDASVAFAAGRGNPSAKAPAPHCVAALDAIRETGGRLVMNQAIRKEWKNRAGTYAKKWWKVMLSTKRLDVVNTTWPAEREFLQCAAELPGKGPREVARDVHLVSAAMLTDKKVVSGDRAQRALLCTLSAEMPVLRELDWAVPTCGACENWIREGARDHVPFGIQPGAA